MPPPHHVRFTDRELDIMQVLWELDSGTVADVRERLEDSLAYTTVLTMLRTLEEKGHLRREEEGRAHRYFPRVDRAEARTSALRHVLHRLFGGDPEVLLTHLVSERDLTPGELERMRRLLEGDER